MKIGQVAKSAGITVEAIRFYEKEGLIEIPSRTSSGYRNYSAEQTKIISFIKHNFVYPEKHNRYFDKF